MKKVFILFTLLASLAAQAQNESFRTFSLKQAIEYGVQNNISAKNAKLSEQQAKARNHELLSNGLPQINANFDYTYYIIRPTSPAFTATFGNLFPSGLQRLPVLDAVTNAQTGTYVPFKLDMPKDLYFVLKNNVSTGVNLNQLVYDTRFFVGIQTFKSLLKVSQLTTALTEQDVKYSIIKSYADVQAAREILRNLDSNLAIVNKLVDDTRETYKAGLIEELDVNRIELGQSNLKSQINNTRNLYNLSLSALKYYMGLQITDKIALTDDVETLRKQLSSDLPASFDPSQRIESDLLQTAIKLKDYDRRQRKAGYYPSIYGFGNFGGGSQVNQVKNFFERQHYSDGTTGSNWFMQSYVGFTIKVPIYDGGQKEASVKQAKIELQKAKNDLDNFRNQSSLQVEAARTTYQTNLIEEENARRSMELNNKIFTKSSIKFKEGVSSSFELMQTQSDQTTNQIRYYNAVRTVLESRADLDKALGIK